MGGWFGGCLQEKGKGGGECVSGFLKGKKVEAADIRAGDNGSDQILGNHCLSSRCFFLQVPTMPCD